MALLDEGKNTVDNNSVIDLNIEGIKKTAFRINGDNTAIIELNLSDLNIGERLEKGYSNLQKAISEIAELPEDANLSEELAKADKVMREQIDYIFDSNVSEVCGRGGSMYDPKDGSYRFEHIINSLLKLYDENLNEEYTKMKKRIQKHTDQYVKEQKKPRKK